MFCFKAGVFLEELKKYSPKIYQTSKKCMERFITKSETSSGQNSPHSNLIRIKHEDMEKIPEE